MGKQLYTIDELSELLSIKKSRIRTAIFNKEISYKKIGRLIRFTQNDIENFINKNKVEACDEQYYSVKWKLGN